MIGHTANKYRYLIGLLVIASVSGLTSGDDAESTWSFSLGNINLFDIPKIPGAVFNAGTAKIQRHVDNAMKSLLDDVAVDPDIIEDSLLKTVGFSFLIVFSKCSKIYIIVILYFQYIYYIA